MQPFTMDIDVSTVLLASGHKYFEIGNIFHFHGQKMKFIGQVCCRAWSCRSTLLEMFAVDHVTG
jgi:hypothetical protein